MAQAHLQEFDITPKKKRKKTHEPITGDWWLITTNFLNIWTYDDDAFWMNKRWSKLKQEKKIRRELTRKLKPVTLQREVAMEALERESSPRCPNIKIGETLKRYWETVTTIIGIAILFTFFASSIKPVFHVASVLLSLFSACSNASSIAFFLFFLKFPCLHKDLRPAIWSRGVNYTFFLSTSAGWIKFIEFGSRLSSSSIIYIQFELNFFKIYYLIIVKIKLKNYIFYFYNL